jgi:hypothetical protein
MCHTKIDKKNDTFSTVKRKDLTLLKPFNINKYTIIHK